MFPVASPANAVARRARAQRTGVSPKRVWRVKKPTMNTSGTVGMMDASTTKIRYIARRAPPTPNVRNTPAMRSPADGIGPAKALIDREPKIVEWAHAAGLTVTPYTFRASAPGKFKDVREEMRHFLFELGVDAVFADNPDQFPRQ